MEKKSFYILDAYALIYRAYYAFINSPMYSSDGKNTSAIFGFFLALEDILRKQKPDYIAVAFDVGHQTFRHQMYDQYKANRQATPEEIKIAVPVIRQALEYLNISILENPLYEADDIIGTIAIKAALQGINAYMVTPDKDYCQLVGNGVFIYKPGRSGNDAEIMGVDEVCKKFSIQHPAQVIDVLALWGDASDNIPGVPGIGEITAKKLIAEYGSTEAILSNIDKLKPAQRATFTENADKLELSKKLVTIHTDVPEDFDPLKFSSKAPNEEKLRNLFNELNFKSLINKFLQAPPSLQKPAKAGPDGYTQGSLFAPAQGNLFESSQAAKQFKTIEEIEHNYKVIETETDVNNLINAIEQNASFCFDTETTGLDPHSDNLVGISFCLEAHTAYYLPINNAIPQSLNLLQKFKSVFENTAIEKTGHNLKFDILFLHYYNIKVAGTLFDTMLAHYLLHPEQNHKLDNLSRKYLEYEMVPIENLIGRKGAAQLNMQQVALEKISAYACEDSDITWQLKQILKPELTKNSLYTLFSTIESKLLEVLVDIEINGFTIDTKYLNNYSNDLGKEIITTENEIYTHANQKFNIASPKQMGEILFEKLKIPYDAKLTKTKQYSTNEETLQQLTEKHPIIELILTYRGLTKLQSTYVEALPRLVNSKSGKIHSSFNQSLTVTGRLSSSNPNLQNIPIRDAQGREIRRAFVPSPGCTLLSADYSQIELRVMAHISNDLAMIEAFSNNADIHTSTAAKVFHVNENEVTREQRSKAKTANFGIIYGISAFGLAQRMNISRTEASVLISDYFKVFGGVQKYMTNAIAQAREKGYVETMMGRRRYLPDINSQNQVVRGMAERNAINTPIQGTAADIIKLAMINIHNKFKTNNLKSKMILQVHDELVFDVLNQELEEVKQIVVYEMENAVKLTVPLLVECGTGANWLEAH